MICDFRHGRSLTIEQQDLIALAFPVLSSRFGGNFLLKTNKKETIEFPID